MSFLFEVNLNLSPDAWIVQANEIMSANKSSAVKFNDAFVLADFRSYCGESLDIAVDKWLPGVDNSTTGYDIDGEFAIAAVLPARREVVLARDWSGVRNVFYTIEGDRLVVGSNVYQVVSSRHDRKFSLISCAEYLAYEYVAEPKTLFDSVFCVPRGKTVVINVDGKITIKGCSKLIPLAVEGVELYSGLRDSITRAHQKRLGHTNGIYLSGGIDSTVMAIALKQDLGLEQVHALTFRTIGAEQDESEEAENVAKQLGLSYECVSVDPTRSVDLSDVIDRSNFPYPGAIFLECIADHIRGAELHGITLFAGQDTRLHTPSYNILDRLVLHHFLDSQFSRQILTLAGFVIKGLFKDGRIHKGGERLFMGADLSAYVARYFYHCHQLGTRTPGGRLASEKLLADIVENVSFVNSSREVFNDIVNLAWDRQYTSDMAYMGGVTRSYGNQCSLPFYDRDLANYSASIPMDIALKTTVGRAGHSGAKKRVNKFVLREAYKKDLTPHMIFRDKAVCITNHLYLNGCMSEYVTDLFHAPVLRDTEIGQQLELGPLYQRGIDKNGKWTMHEYEQVVETHNLLFLEIIARKYGIKC